MTQVQLPQSGQIGERSRQRGQLVVGQTQHLRDREAVRQRRGGGNFTLVMFQPLLSDVLTPLLHLMENHRAPPPVCCLLPSRSTSEAFSEAGSSPPETPGQLQALQRGHLNEHFPKGASGLSDQSGRRSCVQSAANPSSTLGSDHCRH